YAFTFADGVGVVRSSHMVVCLPTHVQIPQRHKPPRRWFTTRCGISARADTGGCFFRCRGQWLLRLLLTLMVVPLATDNGDKCKIPKWGLEIAWSTVRSGSEMVKGYRQEHVYKHPWERVSAASWRKFADPMNRSTLSHILEVDTVSRTLDCTSGRLYTTRLITVKTP
ncbi:hypothetical protein KI387_013404, partial [Taxus chinensis]